MPTLLIDDQLVHAAGSEGGADSIDDSQAGVNVGQELALSLGRICAILEKDNLGLLMVDQRPWIKETDLLDILQLVLEIWSGTQKRSVLEHLERVERNAHMTMGFNDTCLLCSRRDRVVIVVLLVTRPSLMCWFGDVSWHHVHNAIIYVSLLETCSTPKWVMMNLA